jgi:pterin-4a-carbinolamine dehydratase
MKIAIINDTHFGARNDHQLFLDHFLSFFENQFFPYIKENNIKHIFHLGDFFDRRKYINFHTLNEVRKRFLDVLVCDNIKMHMLVGNHDTYYKNTSEVNSMEELAGYGKIYTGPKVVEFDGTPILLMPWINANNYDESIKELNNQIDNWNTVKEDQTFKLTKYFKFENFEKSLSFINQVSTIAETEGHHPDLSFGWGYANIIIFTHAVKGLTESDFILAAKIDQVSA